MHTTDKQRHMTKEKSHGQNLLKTGQVNQETFKHQSKGFFLRKSMVRQVALKYFQIPITRVLRLVARNLFPALYSPF